jgi:hypothetical protein
MRTRGWEEPTITELEGKDEMKAKTKVEGRG